MKLMSIGEKIIGCAILIGIAGIIVVTLRAPTAPRFTEQQIEAYKAQTEAYEARKQQEEQQKAAKAAKDRAQAVKDRALCNIASVCKKYGTVRQDCAVAGNFKNCVQVKMGGMPQILLK